MNPLSERCTARAKTTGERCKRMVIGGGVCRKHGGAAPQVAAKREARILAAEAALRGDPVIDRTPAEALLSASKDADAILQRLKRQAEQTGTLDRATLAALGEWIDRAARVTKTVVESKVDEAIAQREQLAALTSAEWVVSLLVHTLNAAQVTERQRDRVRAALPRLLDPGNPQPAATLDAISTHPPETVVREVRVPTPVFIDLPKRKALTAGPARGNAVWVDGVPIYVDE